MKLLLIVVTLFLTFLPVSGHAENALDICNKKSVRDINFNEFTYVSSFGKLRLHKGELVSSNYRESAQIIKIAYGELGDFRNAASVVIGYSGGGSGYFTEGYIYSIKKGCPYLITRFAGGDRADNGIRNINIDNRKLIIERYVLSNKGGMNDIDHVVASSYQLVEDRLILNSERKID